MVDRRLIGSWLEGPAQATREPGDYPGRRLGLPEQGRGSIARFGRRLLALLVDWGLCQLVSFGFFGGDQWATLAVFTAENVLLVGTAGGTVGHRLLGLRVVREAGGPASLLQALGRSVLLSLALPALIWDRDQRGLHDRFVRTLLVRTRG